VNTLGRFVALIAVFAFFALFVEGGKFYTPRNLENIARQSAVYATAAIGMTLVIIAGGIDLSVGSVIALTVVVMAWVLDRPAFAADGPMTARHLIDQWPTLLPLAAMAAGLAVAVVAGLLNGLLIVGLRLVPFIVTLGTMGIIRGVAKGIAAEKDIYPPEDTWLVSIMDPTLTSRDASRSWMLLPPGIWMLLVAAATGAVILRYTRFGRHVYAIGSNENTARLCGVPVERTKIVVYMLAGLFGGLAGILQFSFISGIGQPTTAIAYELFVIAAVVIGGGSLLGGEGSILGSFIGALIITILYMGGQQMGWPKWVQETVIGGIIIAAVALDRIRHQASD
jgi:ribose transport system permease protein/erythritol transport system permease protein